MPHKPVLSLRARAHRAGIALRQERFSRPRGLQVGALAAAAVAFGGLCPARGR